MAKYIEREYVLKYMEDSYKNAGISAEAASKVRNWLYKAPAADVRPVVRGKWKDAMQSCHDSPHVKCSVCGEYYWRYFKKFNFCPNCGADMREER